MDSRSEPMTQALADAGRIGLGTAALAVPYGPPGRQLPPPDHADAVRAIRHALELGVRAIDTAPGYGAAEELVGEATRGRPSWVATKLALPEGGWEACSPRQVAAAVQTSAEASLRRLGRERLDLLQVHNADRPLIQEGAVPAALVALRDRGLTGLTGATVYGEEDAVAAIESGAFDVVQIAYSVLDRRPERSVLGAAARWRVALMARSVLVRGVLSGAARQLTGSFTPLREAVDDFRRLAGAGWDELAGAALAWVIGQPAISLALIGPRDEAELRALLTGAERFAERVGRANVPDFSLPPELIDPRRWPEEAVVGV